MAETNTNTNTPTQGATTAPSTGVQKQSKTKVHPTLGEYRKCIVHLTKFAQQNTSIFVGINNSTFEFQHSIEIELPKGVISFLREATTTEHFYDAGAISDNGNKGMHSSRSAKKYIVETIND